MIYTHRDTNGVMRSKVRAEVLTSLIDEGHLIPATIKSKEKAFKFIEDGAVPTRFGKTFFWKDEFLILEEH